MVVWDKGRMGVGWHYRRSYEVVLVGEKRGTGKARWHGKTKTIENIIRPSDYGIRKIIPRADEHPTEKPAALSAHFIGLHSQPGETVLDPFMGCGSTGVAAVKNDRRFIGIELDQAFLSEAVRRIAEAQNLPVPRLA